MIRRSAFRYALTTRYWWQCPFAYVVAAILRKIVDEYTAVPPIIALHSDSGFGHPLIDQRGNKPHGLSRSRSPSLSSISVPVCFAPASSPQRLTVSARDISVSHSPYSPFVGLIMPRSFSSSSDCAQPRMPHDQARDGLRRAVSAYERATFSK